MTMKSSDVAADAARSGSVSAAEWAVRVDLAACYRLAAVHRWTDHIYTHFSAKVPGAQDQYLVNAYGLGFDEVTASNLVRVDLQGRVLHDPTGLGINPAGFVIHSAVHAARPDAHCVLHTHTRDGIAVSALAEGLLMLSQQAMRFDGRVGYHDYEGIALDLGEQQRLVRDLGQANVLVLRHHGLLVCGRSCAEAFQDLYALERACTIQMAVLAAGRPIAPVAPGVASGVGVTARAHLGGDLTHRQWTAFRRLLDRTQPDYAR